MSVLSERFVIHKREVWPFLENGSRLTQYSPFLFNKIKNNTVVLLIRVISLQICKFVYIQ